ncbi:hypothetical protein FC21_GL000756 [Limosilactobacillus equigenerosi DSM 18793 = JCM 14505]|uniref:NADH:flavin oxidoreductase/NADH oxidase N-terminal domain-containing protein n=1 Tax=Limosilactobacillus equigenerosi DSM 18793 = JCM 14505 TaxID=1423742 RepID=A0A0R1USA5_9LACO|nr:hypothetical protein FC21_GL000756 [Limosilactobacillus equigenerosi DSM 18793 = JCM 14505]
MSTGGLLPLAPNFPVYGGYQIPFATQIKQAVSIPVTGVGLIDSPTLAEHLLQTNQVDLVEIGRTLIREPNWLVHAAHVLHDHDFAPYNHSYERGTKGY